jgi:uncharacterized protein YpiB (UPF0302 family)
VKPEWMNGIQNHLQLLKGGLKYSSLCEVNVFVKNTQLILEFSFAIPGTSPAIETVFSITNAMWTDEKSPFLVETTKAVIVIKIHFEELSCNHTYTLISNSPKLLQEIRSSTKYKTSAQEERTSPSTLTGN